eukprot:3197783-Amphidinium_carterae.1
MARRFEKSHLRPFKDRPVRICAHPQDRPTWTLPAQERRHHTHKVYIVKDTQLVDMLSWLKLKRGQKRQATYISPTCQGLQHEHVQSGEKSEETKQYGGSLP